MNTMNTLKISRTTSSKLEHPRIFPEYNYDDDQNLLTVSFTDSDLDKILKTEDSILVFNHWYKQIDKIHEFGVVKDIFRNNKDISIKLPADKGDIKFCIFSYDEQSGKKLISTNILVQEFSEDGTTLVTKNNPTYPWKIEVNERLNEPWLLNYDQNRKQYIIEVMSSDLLNAIKTNPGYQISTQILFLKSILQRSLYEKIYRKEDFESSEIHQMFLKIINKLNTDENPCPIKNFNDENQADKYEECLAWIDDVCGNFFLLKNTHNKFNDFLDIASHGEIDQDE